MTIKKQPNYIKRFSIKTFRQAKRVIRIVFGLTLLVVGLLMIILPGPASVVIPIALGILAGEIFWARWLLNKFNRTLLAILESSRKYKGKDK